MSVKSPSYITKSHHGIYYFQIRVDKILRFRLGIKSKIYRKSLKTKDKKVALRLARRLWVELYSNDDEWSKMTKIPKIGTKEYEQWEDKWQDQERIKSRSIRTALDVDDRLSKIPSWDFEARELTYESLSMDELAALQYISDNGIILDEYREESLNKIPKHTKLTTSSRASKKLSELLEDYLIDVKSNRGSVRTLDLYRDQIIMFIELVSDIDSSRLTYDHVNSYKLALPKIPKNRNKKKIFKGKSLKKLIRMDIDSKDLLSESSQKTYSTNVKAFLDWATKRKYLESDVATALERVFKKAISYPYLPFDNDDLQKIFLGSAYMKGEHRTSEKYWIPLIGLFTGARANEICQLSISDIKSKAGVHYFDFNDDGYKSLKNQSSKRLTPIHSELIKLDFLKFIEQKRKSDSIRLFSELSEYKGKYSHNFSKWFSRYLVKCGVESVQPDRRKAFHSFRHTFSKTLRNGREEIPAENIEELTGHAHKGILLKVYARELALEKKLKVIEGLKYKLNLNQIRRWRG